MKRDLAWAKKMHNTFPPTGYSLTGEEIEAFMQAAGEKYVDKISFAYNAIITAYHYGFIRGQRCEQNSRKRKTAQKGG